MELAWLGYFLFILGTCISLLNLYLSFLRYPLHKLLGWEYQRVSGIPLFGSFFLVVAALLLRNSPQWLRASLGIALIDTGGLHWFLGIMLWYAALHHRRGV